MKLKIGFVWFPYPFHSNWLNERFTITLLWLVIMRRQNEKILMKVNCKWHCRQSQNNCFRTIVHNFWLDNKLNTTSKATTSRAHFLRWLSFSAFVVRVSSLGIIWSYSSFSCFTYFFFFFFRLLLKMRIKAKVILCERRFGVRSFMLEEYFIAKMPCDFYKLLLFACATEQNLAYELKQNEWKPVGMREKRERVSK